MSERILNRRWIYLGMAAVVFVVGVLSRKQQVGNPILDKYLGDALYAVLFYLCLAVVWPNTSLPVRIVATSLFVICIELFQLTGIPLAMRQSDSKVSKLISIVLGTKFGWADMLAYFAGIAAIAGADLALMRLTVKKIEIE